MDISDNTIRKMPCFTSQAQDLTRALDLKQAIDDGKPVFVVLIDPGPRRGSIGRIQDIRYIVERAGLKFFSPYCSFQYAVEFDGRDPMVLGTGQFSWFKGYEGPTVWKFVRKAKAPAAQILDKAGTELKVGDTVVVSRDDNLVVGRLTRRSDKGTVWISAIQMREDEEERKEVQIISVRPDTILKLCNTMLDQVMLAKLAN